MPELRHDPLLQRWVIVSAERSARPVAEAGYAGAQTGDLPCPFCPGHEAKTLPEITANRPADTAPDSPGWRVRVVPNKYPALRPDAPELEGLGPLFGRRGGKGHHEVIVEGEDHTRSVSELAPDRMQEVVSVYRERFRALSTVSGLESAVLIKNVGIEAGASIEHSHSQLIATPLLPPTLELEMRSAAEWRRQGRDCIWCSIIREERARQERVVFEEGGLIALCPWASRFPYETWILPRAHASHFERATDRDVVELATCTQRLLNAVEACLHRPPYNYVVHSAPFPTGESLDYHWRLSLLPRITHAAGYEQATGLYINPLLPETAAADLRSRLVGAIGLEPAGR